MDNTGKKNGDVPLNPAEKLPQGTMTLKVSSNLMLIGRKNLLIIKNQLSLHELK